MVGSRVYSKVAWVLFLLPVWQRRVPQRKGECSSSAGINFNTRGVRDVLIMGSRVYSKVARVLFLIPMM